MPDDGFVNLSGGEVVHLVHPGGDETFVVTQIEVGFRAVIGHENFTVLEWTHGSRIHIDVWVQFDHGNFKAPGLEDGGKRRSGNPLPRDDTTPPVTNTNLVIAEGAQRHKQEIQIIT